MKIRKHGDIMNPNDTLLHSYISVFFYFLKHGSNKELSIHYKEIRLELEGWPRVHSTLIEDLCSVSRTHTSKQPGCNSYLQINSLLRP